MTAPLRGVGFAMPNESQVSIRLLWPFARLVPADSRLAASLRRAGIHAAEFANPSTRLPHRTVIRLLLDAMEATANPLLGLRAGQLVEAGDLEVLEYVARNRANVGDAVACAAHYLRLLHDAAELSSVPEGPNVALCIRTTDGVPLPAAANDFMVAVMLGFLRRNATVEIPVLEARMVHQRPAHAAEYARFFNAPVRFGATCNAVVIAREHLAVPFIQAERHLARAFEQRANRLLTDLRRTDGIAGRVRDVVARRGVGDVTMEWTACRLGMSVATLRRRLDAEGTTFSDIVDAVRKSSAERHLQEGSATISEVAFLLGFSSVGAFHRAFKRWTGVAPAAYRSTMRLREPVRHAPLS